MVPLASIGRLGEKLSDICTACRSALLRGSFPLGYIFIISKFPRAFTRLKGVSAIHKSNTKLNSNVFHFLDITFMYKMFKSSQEPVLLWKCSHVKYRYLFIMENNSQTGCIFLTTQTWCLRFCTERERVCASFYIFVFVVIYRAITNETIHRESWGWAIFTLFICYVVGPQYGKTISDTGINSYHATWL
jgi:hypothetical protein